MTLNEVQCEEGDGEDLNESIWEVVDFEKKHILLIKHVGDEKEYKKYKMNGKMKQLKIPQKITY